MPRLTIEDKLLEVSGAHDTPEAFVRAVTELHPSQARWGASHLLQQWMAWEASGMRGFSPVSRLAAPSATDRRNVALLQTIGACAEATHYRRLRHDQFPVWAEGLGGRRCVEFNGTRGRVLFGGDADRETVYIEQISVERRGAGLGTALMAAIRDFAIERKLGLLVYKVGNDAFFGGLGWLERAEHNGNVTYEATLETLLIADENRAGAPAPSSSR